MPAVIRQTRNLDDSFHEFLRHPAPLLLIGQLAVLGVARGLVGHWAWTDLIVAAAVVAAQPFTEWVLHVTVLHCPADGGRATRSRATATGVTTRSRATCATSSSTPTSCTADGWSTS